MHFGIISAPVPGHLYPNCTLAKELINRGHRSTVFNIEDASDFVLSKGIDFVPVGKEKFPKGIWHKLWKPAAYGSNLYRDTRILKVHIKVADMMLKELPYLMKEAKIDVIICDHLQPQGATIAEFLKIPLITVCSTLPLFNDKTGIYPPAFAWWLPTGGSITKLKNKFGHFLIRVLSTAFMRMINKHRKALKCKSNQKLTDTFSNLLQISVIPEDFDFPHPNLPSIYKPVGPFISEREIVPFPWDELDERKIIYLSLGTLRNHIKKLYVLTAKVIADYKEYRLVISKGAWIGNATVFKNLPGDPIIVDYASQLELLKKADLCINHGGAGTVLECLSLGVPVLIYALADDQPAMASRVKYYKLGEIIPWKKVNEKKIRSALNKLISSQSYKKKCLLMKDHIKNSGGLLKAADLIEENLKIMILDKSF